MHKTTSNEELQTKILKEIDEIKMTNTLYHDRDILVGWLNDLKKAVNSDPRLITDLWFYSIFNREVTQLLYNLKPETVE